MMVDSAGRETLSQCQDLNKLEKVPQQGKKAGRVQGHEPERHSVFRKKGKSLILEEIGEASGDGGQ